MRLATRISVHLAVIGAALVAAGLWPMAMAAPATRTTPTASAATYRPPTTKRTPAPQVRSHRTRPRPHRVTRPRPTATPAATRTASARATTRSTVNRTTRRHRRAHHRTVSGPTSWSALNEAIARIPTYRAGAARWVISSRYGHWGTADWYDDVMYISPSVPTGYLYDVAVHEWSHELSVLDYGGDVDAAVRAMDAYFGGSGLSGAEDAADCMAILQGATWTHYTSCDNSHWRAGAARLLRGEHL